MNARTRNNLTHLAEMISTAYQGDDLNLIAIRHDTQAAANDAARDGDNDEADALRKILGNSATPFYASLMGPTGCAQIAQELTALL